MARFLSARAIMTVRDEVVIALAEPKGEGKLACTLKWTGDLDAELRTALQDRTEVIGALDPSVRLAAFYITLDPEFDGSHRHGLERIEEILLSFNPGWVPEWTLQYGFKSAAKLEIRITCSRREPRAHRRLVTYFENAREGHLQWLQNELLSTPDFCIPQMCWVDDGALCADVTGKRAVVWTKTAATIAGMVEHLLLSRP